MKEKNFLTFSVYILFLGGWFGFIMGMIAYFTGKSPAEYGVLGIGGGAYLVGSAVIMLIRSKLPD